VRDEPWVLGSQPTIGEHPTPVPMSHPIVVEICVDSIDSAVAAERGGAQRVELCSNLLEGGTTPSAGLIEIVRRQIRIGLQVIIRPRGGDFCYTAEEFECLKRDVLTAKQLGADGVVLGILNQEGHVDVPRTRELVALARPMSVTFHRAFDMAADPLGALEDACQTGVDRILTSGGEQECSLGAERIAQLVKAARGRVTIMACGGIRHDNVIAILEDTGVSEIHVGLSKATVSPMLYRNMRVSLGKTKDREYQRWQVLEGDVRELQRSIAVKSGRTVDNQITNESDASAPSDR
jgi:copper homeostasis protein